jgi:FtsP/CotA-like multicopper oxidase with cupredoxin domain
MSFWGKHVSVKLIAMVVVALLLGGLAVAVTRPSPRDVTLVVRGMAFYLEDSSQPNPTIRLRAGERVRIILRNEERGIQHDFASPAIGADLDPIGWNQTADVTFVVPDQPGTYDYWCRPHMLMMRGKIIVQE